MSAANQFGEILQIIFAIVSATCIFLPACSHGESATIITTCIVSPA